ncbi:UNVERIFIED_ORG: hypothetical protein DFO82_2248 [Idiomarina abyssalis]|nr:hypothetical protein DEU30_1085 [Idiomarina sp. 017G]
MIEYGLLIRPKLSPFNNSFKDENRTSCAVYILLRTHDVLEIEGRVYY